MLARKRDERRVRPIVRRRSGGRCEIGIPSVCLGRAENMHHRLPLGRGGEWSEENVVDLCGSGTTGCHGFITELRRYNGLSCYELGWVIHTGTDPASVPWRSA